MRITKASAKLDLDEVEAPQTIHSVMSDNSTPSEAISQLRNAAVCYPLNGQDYTTSVLLGYREDIKFEH